MLNPLTARLHPGHITTERVVWLTLILLALGIALAPLPSGAPLSNPRAVRVEAGEFAYSPAIIKALPGDQITLELVATDVSHGLHLDGYDLEVTAEPGLPGTITFIADRPGVFRFRCSVSCGPLHPFMIGKLEVGSNVLFWRATGLAVLIALAGAWTAIRRQDVEEPS